MREDGAVGGWSSWALASLSLHGNGHILCRISRIFRTSALQELLETLAEAVKALLKLLKTQKMKNIMAFAGSKHLLII